MSKLLIIFLLLVSCSRAPNPVETPCERYHEETMRTAVMQGCVSSTFIIYKSRLKEEIHPMDAFDLCFDVSKNKFDKAREYLWDLTRPPRRKLKTKKESPKKN